MELRYLSDAFFQKHKDYPELMQKGDRPYAILVIETETMKFAVPFRTSMNKAKKYCYVTDKVKKTLDSTLRNLFLCFLKTGLKKMIIQQ